MTGVLHDVARAALPVATALLVCAVAARVALWADLDDERLTYVARQYLRPLSTWCLGAVAVYAITLGGAGEAGAAALALAAGIGAAAVLLRVPDEENGQDEAAPREWPADEDIERRPAAAARPERQAKAPVARPAAEDRSPAETRPLGGGSLWIEPAEDSTRTGLWSR
jgi:hypothetical protein